jgi:tetratricopeptide (TPR) repeat protein
MPAAIGIEFGTRFCRLACLRNGKVEPLGIPQPNWRTAGLAEDPGFDLALKYHFADEQPISIHDRLYRWPELTEALFASLRKSAEGWLGERVQGCVVSVPGSTGNLRRQALRQLLEGAGFSASLLINAASAICLSQSRANADRRLILVACLGAGGMEITLIERSQGAMKALAGRENASVSGQAFTTRLAEHLYHELKRRTGIDASRSPAALRLISQEAERVKICLSAENQVVVDLSQASSQVTRRPEVIQFPITRPQFEELIAGLIDEGQATFKAVLAETQVSPAELSEVWLSGGCAAVPLVQHAVTAWCATPPSLADDYAIAMGAALQASSLEYPGEPVAQPPVPPANIPPVPPVEQPVQGKLLYQAARSPDISLLEQADSLLSQGDYDGALQALSTVIKTARQRQAAIYYQRGSQKEASGKVAEVQAALIDFQQAVKLQPENPEYSQAARRLEQLLLHQEARTQVREGEGLEENALRLIRSNDLSTADKQLQEAYKKYQKSYELDRDNRDYARACARVLAMRAQILRRRAEKERNPSTAQAYRKSSLELVRKALNYTPGDAELHALEQQLRNPLHR